MKTAKQQEKFKPAFKGCMVIPLAGESQETLYEQTKFHGEWLTKRGRILGKERRFKVLAYVFSTEGDKAHEVAKMLERGNEEHLVNTIGLLADAIIQEAQEMEMDVDLTRSKVVVRA